MVRNDAVEKQRRYYSSTAADYDQSHGEEVEHLRALSAFSGFIQGLPHGSFLDVGAGTGSAVRFLSRVFPGARVIGVEPVFALRDIGHHKHGISYEQLVHGDALDLEFGDGSFDWCVETATLHHIEDFRSAVKEMVRVADFGIMFSDSNNMGQGSAAARLTKHMIKAVGLWNLFIKIQTNGRGYKEDAGDGIHYSFSLFDCIPIVQKKFPNIFLMNTIPAGPNLYWSASAVMLIAHR